MPHECTNCGRVFADGSKQMLSGCPDCGGNKFQFQPVTATETSESDSTADAGAGAAATDSTPNTTPNPAPDEPAADESNRDLSAGSREWPDHGYGSGDSGAPDTDPSEPGAPASDSTAAPAARPDDTPESGTDPDDAETTGADAEPPAAGDSIENPAQASARTDVVSPDEIATGGPGEADDPGATESSAAARDDASPPPDADGRVIEPASDDRPDLEDLREELNDQFESIRIVAPGEYELNLMELYDRTEYIISLQEDGRYVIEVPDTWDTTPDPDES